MRDEHDGDATFRAARQQIRSGHQPEAGQPVGEHATEKKEHHLAQRPGGQDEPQGRSRSPAVIQDGERQRDRGNGTA